MFTRTSVHCADRIVATGGSKIPVREGALNVRIELVRNAENPVEASLSRSSGFSVVGPPKSEHSIPRNPLRSPHYCRSPCAGSVEASSWMTFRSSLTRPSPPRPEPSIYSSRAASGPSPTSPWANSQLERRITPRLPPGQPPAPLGRRLVRPGTPSSVFCLATPALLGYCRLRPPPVADRARGLYLLPAPPSCADSAAGPRSPPGPVNATGPPSAAPPSPSWPRRKPSLCPCSSSCSTAGTGAPLPPCSPSPGPPESADSPPPPKAAPVPDSASLPRPRLASPKAMSSSATSGYSSSPSG